MDIRNVLSALGLLAVAALLTPAEAAVSAKQAAHNAAQSANAAAPAMQPSPITMQQDFGPWHASCSYMPATHTATACVVSQQLSMQQQGRTIPIGMVIVGHSVNVATPVLSDRPYEVSLMTPLGFDLTKPSTLTLDSAAPLSMPYIMCTTSGCLSSVQATPTLMASLRGAKDGHIRVAHVAAQGGDVVTINYKMAHFLDALIAVEAWEKVKTPL
ncbi:invasion associated locus B family protein [Acetobacter orientalis]|uniref:invasion associated locus B family protein n=1 Tax=Acetobacter orientalis TaxID=146474 RepID=UPI0039E737D0